MQNNVPSNLVVLKLTEFKNDSQTSIADPKPWKKKKPPKNKAVNGPTPKEPKAVLPKWLTKRQRVKVAKLCNDAGKKEEYKTFTKPQLKRVRRTIVLNYLKSIAHLAPKNQTNKINGPDLSIAAEPRKSPALSSAPKKQNAGSKMSQNHSTNQPKKSFMRRKSNYVEPRNPNNIPLRNETNTSTEYDVRAKQPYIAPTQPSAYIQQCNLLLPSTSETNSLTAVSSRLANLANTGYSYLTDRWWEPQSNNGISNSQSPNAPPVVDTAELATVLLNGMGASSTNPEGSQQQQLRSQYVNAVPSSLEINPQYHMFPTQSAQQPNQADLEAEALQMQLMEIERRIQMIDNTDQDYMLQYGIQQAELIRRKEEELREKERKLARMERELRRGDRRRSRSKSRDRRSRDRDRDRDRDRERDRDRRLYSGRTSTTSYSSSSSHHRHHRHSHERSSRSPQRRQTRSRSPQISSRAKRNTINIYQDEEGKGKEEKQDELNRFGICRHMKRDGRPPQIVERVEHADNHNSHHKNSTKEEVVAISDDELDNRKRTNMKKDVRAEEAVEISDDEH